MPLRAAELEVLVTVNDEQVGKAEKDIKATGERVERNPLKVDADARGALASLERVDAEARKVVSKQTALTINANIERAEKQFMRVYERLDYLRSVETTMDVSADISRAEAQLQRVQRHLDGLRSARTTMVVDVDDDPARQKLEAVEGYAAEAGSDAGDEMGASLIDALSSIPIAGAVLGLGVLAGKALTDGFQQGLQIEVRYDRLAALAGLEGADALRIGRAAGEAYANAFGESIEANMDAARLALQFDIIDENATTRDAQKVIEGLSGISDVLGEEVRPIAQAVTVMLSSGVARSAEHAFDILATGAREGVNRSEDLLDTFTEYPALFARLGLSGEEALGLINQGLDAGAFNSDKVADALKELQIRATDASEASAEGYRLIGLDAEQMTAKMAAGGASAREGLDQILDGLRNIEDPVARNAAGVALVGTQWEDLGDAILALDLSTAVEQLGGVEGAAQRMFDTLADNDATKLEVAKRNIEVGIQAIQGALAAGFSEPLGQAAEWVSQNRGPVLQFFSDLVNGALDFGRSLIEGLADGTEGMGKFVSGPLAEFVDVIAGVLGNLPWPFSGQDTSELKAAAEEMRGFTDTTSAAADVMRTKWVGTVEDMRDGFNEFGDGAVAMGYLNDASLRTAGAIDAVGVAADGSRASLDGIDLANLSATESGRALEAQVRAAIAALSEEVSAAENAGAAQGELTDRYNTATGALVEQLTQMGITEGQARALIDTVLQTPESATTAYSSNAPDEQGKVQALADRITTLPDGSIVITADTGPARQSLDWLISAYSNATVPLRPDVAGAFRGIGGGYHGGVVQFMASGGIPDLTPMSSVASMVPANTWRVVGDRGDVPEAFIPLDGSQRSRSILDEANRMMPGSSPSTTSTEVHVHLHNPITRDLEQEAWEAAQIVGGVVDV